MKQKTKKGKVSEAMKVLGKLRWKGVSTRARSIWSKKMHAAKRAKYL